MKFKIYFLDKAHVIITARDMEQAKKIAEKRYKGYESISLIPFHKPRKSATLNKRQYVKKSDKIYDRKKSKKELRDELG